MGGREFYRGIKLLSASSQSSMFKFMTHGCLHPSVFPGKYLSIYIYIYMPNTSLGGQFLGLTMSRSRGGEE